MIFGSITTDLGDFKESVAQITGNLKTLFTTYKQFNINLQGLSPADISSLQQYIELIDKGASKSAALKTALGNSNGAVREQAQNFTRLNQAFKRNEISAEEYTMATKNLASAQKTATVTSRVLNAALNTLVTAGITVAISLLISGIQKLIRAEEEERQKQDELRRERVKTAEAYKQSEEALDGVIERYSAIVASTDNVITKEKALSKLQDELIEKYGKKADALDLVNKKYSEGVEEIQKFRLAEAEDYVEEAGRNGSYKKAKDTLSKDYAYKYENDLSENRTVSSAADLRYLGTKIKGGLMPAGFSDVLKEAGVFEQTIFQGQGFYVTGTLEEQYEILTKIADVYSKQDDYSEKLLLSINERRDALKEEINDNKKIITEYEAAQRTISELKLPDETKKQVSELLDKAYELNEIAAGDGTAFEKTEAIQNLKDLKEELYDLVGQNQEYRDIIAETFAEFVTGTNAAIDSLEDLDSAWYNDLDEMEKGAIANIDKLKTFIQTIASGDVLNDSDLWTIKRLDTTGILDGIQDVEDISLESLTKLKDSYISTQITIVRGWIVAAQKAKEVQDSIIEVNSKKIAEWKFSEKSLLDPKYRAEYEGLQQGIEEATKLSNQYGKSISNDEILIRQLTKSLGYTVDVQKALNDAVEQLTDEAEGLLKAYQYRIDEIIDGFEAEKEAIESSKDALQEQLDILEEHQKAIQDTIDRYETAANVVAEAIQEQIDALKKQNEEREEAVDLAEKLANLENAKNNKVRTYTEAGGWTYEAKKADVQKAEEELAKTQSDAEIKKLEEYLKKWEKRSNKAEEAANERTAEEILGADYRAKIAQQDEDIFKMYDEEYQKYNEELYQVSNVEMETLKKEIDAKDKEISAKEAQIKSWQKYKTEVTNAANKAKSETESWYKYLSQVTLNEKTTLDQRNANLEDFAKVYGEKLKEIKGYTDQIGSLTASIGFDTSGVEEAARELAEFFAAYSEGVMAMADAYNSDDDHFAQVNSEWDEKLLKAAKGMRLVKSSATGNVVDYTGLMAVHGTKQKAETIFNANDSAKLYDLVHNTPNLIASMFNNGVNIARNFSPADSGSTGISFNNTTINLPNVQNPEQFARQMEMYMQTVLSESQVYKPRR